MFSVLSTRLKNRGRRTEARRIPDLPNTNTAARPSVPVSTRIAAAPLCGLLRVRSALPSLRSLASDPATPAPLRLAARHAAEAAAGR